MISSYALPHKNTKLHQHRSSEPNIVPLSVGSKLKATGRLKGGIGSKSVNYTQQMYDDEEVCVDIVHGQHPDDDVKVNDSENAEDTEALKKELEQSTKKKHRHKDIGKKLVCFLFFPIC